MSNTRYTAVCRRSAKWWAIEVPEVPGVFSQARRLEHVEPTVRDAIALMLDVEPNSFDLAVDIRLPAGLDDEVREVHRVREEAEEAAVDAAERTRHVAARLAAAGLPLRDIGQALGVSHQRVAQLLKAGTTSRG